MSTQTFPSGLPLSTPSGYADGNPAMSFGMVARPDASAEVVADAVRWFAAAGVTARPRIWSPTGVLLASGPAVVCAAGWNTLPLTTPYTMAPGIDVIVGVYQTGGTSYPARPSTFPVAGGVFSANIGLFNLDGDGLATANNSSAAWYGTDIVATVADTPGPDPEPEPEPTTSATGYPHGTTVFRDRRIPVANPQNPDRPTVPAWPAAGVTTGLDVLDLPGVYVAASSTTAVPDAVRTESIDYRSLFSTDRLVDVRVGDRIRSEGLVYLVKQRPQGDINPFTGWAPGVEIPLEGVQG